MHIKTRAVVLNKAAVRILVARGVHNNTKMFAGTFDIYTLLVTSHEPSDHFYFKKN